MHTLNAAKQATLGQAVEQYTARVGAARHHVQVATHCRCGNAAAVPMQVPHRAVEHMHVAGRRCQVAAADRVREMPRSQQNSPSP